MKYSRMKFIFIFLAVTISLFSQTNEGMSLGKLQFIKPTNDVSISSRTLRMKMSATSISPRFYAKVGGVAFIQTATPEFEIDTLSLGCNYIDNNAYATINGILYNIPLEVWQLQPIVEFADDDNNAVVTIFGDSSSRIKLHEAFIDKLLGLRLLQSDLLLASNILNIEDRGEFPSYDGKNYIMTEKEKNLYQSYQLLDSLFLDASYQDVSLVYSFYTNLKLDSIAEKFETYIYTDYNQDITFNIDETEREIVFTGKPYYRFASRDTSLVDTLEMYYSILNYVDTFNVYKHLHNKSISKNTYSKKNNKLLYQLQSISKKRNNIQDKAKSCFEIIDYYNQTKNQDELKDDIIMFSISTLLMKSYVDSLMQCTSETSKVIKLCDEINSIVDDLSYGEYMLFYNLSMDLLKEKQSDDILNAYCSLLKELNITPEQIMIWYLYENRIPGIIEAKRTTEYFRNEGAEYINLINPLIYDEVETTCQWIAFFRYIKQNHTETWDRFKDDVRNLKYDAPEVWTPVDFNFTIDL